MHGKPLNRQHRTDGSQIILLMLRLLPLKGNTMNYRKHIAIMMISLGLAACQSKTEQEPAAPAETVAPQASTHETVIPDANMPLPVRQTQAPSAAIAKPSDKAVSSTPKKTVIHAATKAKAKSAAIPPKPASTVASNVMHKATPAGKTGVVDMHALNKCKACHNFSAKAKVGPGLGKGNGIPGIFERKAGTFPGFKYKFTKYVTGDAWVWDAAHLREWICNSKKAVKKFTGNTNAKTKMPPQHICDPAKQDAVIAALQSIS